MKFNVHQAQTASLLRLLGFVIVMASGLFITSCDDNKEKHETPLEEQVDSFANAYFNWQFYKAIKYVTPESEKWIKYAASQVHTADLKLINAQEEKAHVEIQDIEQEDSTAKIKINVSNYMRMDTIGKAGRMIDEAQFTLFAKYQTTDKKWLIHLTNLPRHEK